MRIALDSRETTGVQATILFPSSVSVLTLFLSPNRGTGSRFFPLEIAFFMRDPQKILVIPLHDLRPDLVKRKRRRMSSVMTINFSLDIIESDDPVRFAAIDRRPAFVLVFFDRVAGFERSPAPRQSGSIFSLQWIGQHRLSASHHKSRSTTPSTSLISARWSSRFCLASLS